MSTLSLVPVTAPHATTEVIDLNGQRWITAEQAGLALGYQSATARQGIIKLFNRHRDEFAAEDSTEVKLTSNDGKQRLTRIFSKTGCIKLGFFSNTPQSKQFRHWAAQVLSAPHVPAVQDTTAEAERVKQLEAAIIAANPLWDRLLRMRQSGLVSREMAGALGISISTVEKQFRQMRALKLIGRVPNRKSSLPPPRRAEAQLDLGV